MYCNTLLEGEVYCNRNCIVGLAGKEIISQYSVLYCDMGAKGNGQGCIAIQPMHLRHGLALCLRHVTGAGCRRAGHAGSRRALGGLGAAGSWGSRSAQASVRGRADGRGASGIAWARRPTLGSAGARQGAQAAGARTAGIGARPRRWVRGLALGCALGALGLFSIRFSTRYFS